MLINRVIAVFILIFFSFVSLFGQTGLVNGSIEGQVIDAKGSAVAGAVVRARSIATGFVREARSGQSGRFSLPLLPLGKYEVTVEASGFSTYTKSGVDVGVGQASMLQVELDVAPTRQTITVEGDASILRLEPWVASRLTAVSMRNLPITSRNVQNLALFAAGLTGRRDDEFGTTQFAFGGMLRRGFMVDGADNTQRGGQLRLGIFSTEAIAEVSVVQNAMSAEYGRTVGGIVNMVTRGGLNDWHGSALTLLRRPGLIARPSLAATKPFQQWGVYAANLGGPLRRDKLFFFGNWEYQPLDAPRPITITPANAQALGLPPTDLGSAPFAQRFRTYLGRIDYNLSARLFGFARYGYFYTPSKFNTSGGLLAQSAGNHFDDRQGSGVVQLTALLSPSIVNEFRFGDLFRRFWRPPVSGVVGPVTMITGVANIGSNTSAAQYYFEHQNQFIDNLSWRSRSHSVKLGADIARIRVRQNDRLAQTFVFANLPNYLAAISGVANPANNRPGTHYVTLTQQFGDNSAEHSTWSTNFFVQDDWALTPNFTLSLGVRYENLLYPNLNEKAPRPESRGIPGDSNNWAPRVGFAWAPAKRLALRGGYGLFYDTLNLRLISAAIRGDGERVKTYRVAGNNPAAPSYPTGFLAPPSDPSLAVLPSVFGFAQDFRTMYAHQANLQQEIAVLDDLSVTLGYQFYGSRRAPLLVDVNLIPGASARPDGRVIFSTQRVDPRFNQVQVLQSVANGWYHGGFIAVHKRLSHGLLATASYTLGRAENMSDAAGDSGSPVSDPLNFRRDYGPSSADQRHRFVLQAVWQPIAPRGAAWGALVNGWMVAPNVTLTSGFPVNVVAGSDLNNDLVNNDRPDYRQRHDVRGPGFKEVNLRVSRTFRFWRERLGLEVIAEAENLFNSTNAACGIGGCSGAVVNRFGAPDFLRITSALNSRQIQLGGRFKF
jgi:outer membrane receptor protein involved in Fe transport